MRQAQKRRFSISWLSMGYAGIWLVFLIFPIVSLWNDTEFSQGQKIFASGLFAVFCLLYLASYGINTVLRAPNQTVRTLWWSIIVLFPVIALTFFIGAWAFCFSVYFVAMWAFQNALEKGIWVGLFITVLSSVAMWFFAPEVFANAGYGFIGGAIFVLIMGTLTAVSEHRQESQQALLQAELSERIARDVHDILGHSLTVINLKAELASALVASQPEKAADEVRQISVLSRTALAEVRATVTRIKSPSFAGELEAAKRALETAQITAHLPSKEQVSEQNSNTVLFSWVLREAVTNVVRHSRAKNCWVLIEPERIEIVDDGASAIIAPGNGLSGLKSRVEESGSELRISTGNYTRLLVTMNGDTSPLLSPESSSWTPSRF